MPRRHAQTLRFLAAPTDVLHTTTGGVHGGRVLEWIDKAAFACATAWSGTYCVTAYVGHIHFRRPIPSGHLVEVRSRIAYTGRSSMHIINEVLSGDPKDGTLTRACDCLVIFVAIGDDGRTVPVEPFAPADEQQERDQQAALERIPLRAAIEEEMQSQNYTDAGTAPSMVTRFMASPTDVNWGGNVHGGTAMEWLDQAAQLCTTAYCGHSTVAIYAGGIRFFKPVRIGDLVEVRARLMRTGTTTMQVSVFLYSGDPRTGELNQAIHAGIVYMALDHEGTALMVPEWEPVSEEDKILNEHSFALRELREKYHPLPLVDEHTTIYY